ncbi:MAG TPA: hypothetical protein VN325_21760 [Steroidobacteraceae bacterium]|nr:hypothetical protein [Steroidobacteraceae bacterium]
METEQLTWSAGGGWRPSVGVCNEAHLVLYFGASDALGTDSYGEIAPHSRSGDCDLDNQTMTITVISEVAA